ncbi:hypothetical protein SLA2020_480470 [Shorea laevis]
MPTIHIDELKRKHEKSAFANPKEEANSDKGEVDKRLNRGAEEDDDDEDDADGLEAWERTYADERSWESLPEDESGFLRPIDNKAIYHAWSRRRLRSHSSSAAATRIQKGLIRYLYIVIDLSRAAAEMDFRPNRMVVVAKHVQAFISEFFEQNPLGQTGLLTIKDGVAHCLTDLGGTPEAHIKALTGKLECAGDSSLQNALDLAHEYLNQIPSYGHCEVLILYSALSICDPGDIMETVQKCKKSKIRCSVIGLAAEMFICKHLCRETCGMYSVALDETHIKESILEHAPPPPAIAEFAIANLIKMGFPQRAEEGGSLSICSCHKEAKPVSPPPSNSVVVVLLACSHFLRTLQMASPEKACTLDNLAFMELAIQQAKLAMENLEVPVGCVFIEDGKVIASGRNRPTETRNATRHAEMEAIDVLLEMWQRDGLSAAEVAEKFSKCVLYVTCEPCIMCAAALSIIGIKEVYYGCSNDKFGGCGSILSLHSSGSETLISGNPQKKDFKCTGGLMASEAISLLRSFYEQGNPSAPKPHRPLVQKAAD